MIPADIPVVPLGFQADEVTVLMSITLTKFLKTNLHHHKIMLNFLRPTIAHGVVIYTEKARFVMP